MEPQKITKCPALPELCNSWQCEESAGPECDHTVETRKSTISISDLIGNAGSQVFDFSRAAVSQAAFLY